MNSKERRAIHARARATTSPVAGSAGQAPTMRTPVAWVLPDIQGGEYSGVTLTRSKPIAERHNGKPLFYAEDSATPSPPQAALTDAQIFEILKSINPTAVRLPTGWREFARALLAAAH